MIQRKWFSLAVVTISVILGSAVIVMSRFDSDKDASEKRKATEVSRERERELRSADKAEPREVRKTGRKSFAIETFNIGADTRSTRSLFPLAAPGELTFGLDDEFGRGEEGENAFDEIEEAMEFEFNMTKDPATGRIPEGIHEAERAEAKEVSMQQRRQNLPEAFSYSFQGPDNLGGRTRTIVYDVRYNGTSNRTILAGGISGGVYKSTDDGATWVRKSSTGDLYSVTTLAQDKRAGFQDTWYYAGGEVSGNSAGATGASYRGKGVYKSTDNGETWTFLATSNTGVYEVFDHRADYVNRLAVDTTTGFVYMSATDSIYRSTDGGATWSSVLSSGASYGSTMMTDIAITSGGRLYAAFAGASNPSATGGPGVWTSTTGDSGTWTRIAGPGGTPATWNADGGYGRLVIAIAPSNENIVYALYYNNLTYTCAAPAPEAELFRWDNATTTWTDLSATLPDDAGCLSGNDPFAVQGGYDLVVAVKPNDPATIFIGGTNIYRSTDTGATWTRVGGYGSALSYALYPSSHPDIHAIAFQPTNSSIMLCGNDGGIQRTTDDLAGAVAWTPINTGYRTYQYYYVVNDPRSGNAKVLGGAQDNGTTRNTGGTGTLFESVFGGDGVSVGLTDLIGGVQYEYVGSQNGSIVRRPSTSGSGSGTSIRPTAATTNGLFVTLFKVDPDNTETVYYANTNTLYRTTSGSTVTTGTWTSMTGVGTAASGTSITAIGLTRGTYNAATSSLFLGTNGGKVFRLDDPTSAAAATATPVDITGAAFPTGFVSSIAVSPQNDDVVMVTFSNYAVTSVFWTGNANSATPTWTAVEGNLTLPSFRSSAIAFTNQLQYFVGTSTGLYSVTGLPAAPTWVKEGPNDMGDVVVSNLDLRPSDNKLLVGTHGYGMWSSNLAAGATPTPTPTPTATPTPTPTATPTPTPTPTATPTPTPTPPYRLPVDYDGDRKTDVSVYRPSNGGWYIDRSQAGPYGISFGTSTDKITPEDFDGDRKTDVTVYRPSQGAWYSFRSSTSTVSVTSFGNATDVPVPGDYDGDGRADTAIFRVASGQWWINGTTAGIYVTSFGGTGDVPVLGDFDGDRRSDIAIYRPATGYWWIFRSTLGITAIPFGASTDKVVPADYDGDGKTDIAVWRPSNGAWYVMNWATFGTTVTSFGASTDIPVPGDYDGDGRADTAIFRPIAAGQFWLNRTTGGILVLAFGTTGDIATANAYGN